MVFGRINVMTTVIFKKIVSEEAISGGVRSNAGCLTEAAEEARQAAAQRYYDKQKTF
jgi:hypothetical protein